MTVRRLQTRLEKLERHVGSQDHRSDPGEVLTRLMTSTSQIASDDIARILQAYRWGFEPPQASRFTDKLFTVCRWISDTVGGSLPAEHLRFQDAFLRAFQLEGDAETREQIRQRIFDMERELEKLEAEGAPDPEADEQVAYVADLLRVAGTLPH